LPGNKKSGRERYWPSLRKICDRQEGKKEPRYRFSPEPKEKGGRQTKRGDDISKTTQKKKTPLSKKGGAGGKGKKVMHSIEKKFRAEALSVAVGKGRFLEFGEGVWHPFLFRGKKGSTAQKGSGKKGTDQKGRPNRGHSSAKGSKGKNGNF